MKWRSHLCALACAAFVTVARQPSEAADSVPRESPAVTPAEIDMTKAREFWAFQPVKSPPVPKARSSRFKVQNPVDAFILARLQEKGLQPSPPAAKSELIRRLCFDLTGLPPAPEEIKAFA